MFTVFNFKGGGHIVISNDDLAEPVLGYGLTSYQNSEDLNPGLELLFEQYKNEINYLKKGKFSENTEIKQKWDSLSKETASSQLKSYNVGGILYTNLWSQGTPYNDSCPIYPVNGERCLIGCNGVALGGVIDYWGNKGEDIFPDSTASTSCWTLGNNIYTINFYEQNYNWSDIGNYMPPTAQFLSHCAIATDPCPFRSDLTGSTINYVKNALELYFSFKTDGVQSKDSFSSTEWENLLKNEINNERPVIYSGGSTVNYGHTWIIDGYDSNNYFHCNWGWGNSNNVNDFYSLTSLNPEVNDTTTYYYTTDFKALTGIKPLLGSDFDISGPSIVCSSNTTFEVSVPASARIEWGKTDNLNQVGGNTSTTFTVNAASSGVAGITVIIKNSQGDTLLTKSKYLWAGTPVITGLDGPTSVPTNTDTRYYPLYGYQIASPTNFMWMVTPDDGVSYDSYGWSTLVNFSYPDYYRIIYRGLNTCGWGDWYYSDNIYVYSSLSLSISPNPISGETIISIETVDKEATSAIETEETAFDETVEWSFEVYDNVQSLKLRKTSLKGRNATINTQSWKEGVYFVRVLYKNEVLIGKLIVKN